jgi:hypothetical protein
MCKGAFDSNISQHWIEQYKTKQDSIWQDKIVPEREVIFATKKDTGTKIKKSRTYMDENDD